MLTIHLQKWICHLMWDATTVTYTVLCNYFVSLRNRVWKVIICIYSLISVWQSYVLDRAHKFCFWYVPPLMFNHCCLILLWAGHGRLIKIFQSICVESLPSLPFWKWKCIRATDKSYHVKVCNRIFVIP